MANLKEIRNRITSISSTMQITSAMKMVSAAKLRKAQDAIVQMRPYSNKLQEILANLSTSLDSNDGVYSRERELKNVLLVSITSNRGLCGGFNNNVIKAARKLALTEYATCNVTILSIGKKSHDAFKNTQWGIIGSELPRHTEKIWDNLTFEASSKIATVLMEQFANGNQDKIVFIYNQFKNAAVQLIQEEQFLPVLAPEIKKGNSANSTDYIFEPNKEFIVQELIPKSLKTQLFKALLDSRASEHGARMTAMHKATDNASDLIHELKLVYNKARQAAITNEILEIVAGAEALK
ncbi:MAG: ATP synthase F1 subunit gamma [Bacteroidetes bacterium RIFCSPLOWO2_12_FULL_31_6]|nr:MAG: ATP synthase F1 subunit gamma [Bacteroidetes bacterium RIFCSPLOWO2_12_FULL_31_6]